MPLPVKRWSVVAFVISFAIVSINALAAGEGQIIKINGHDYLTVDNISKFYGLPAEVVPSGAKIQSETADHPLEFVGCSREAMINRSEEHTSELQSRFDLVCLLLLEK